MPTLIFTVSKTRGLRARTRLRRFGVLSEYKSGTLVVYVTKHGEESTRRAALQALEG